MKRKARIVLSAALCGALCPLPATAAPATPRLQISLPGDDVMDCPAIAGEVGRMETIVLDTRADQKKASETGTGIKVVRTVGSFLVGSLTGAIGVMAAGHLAGVAASDREESAEAVEETALQRRSLMIGMYRAKGCAADTPLQTVLTDDGETAPDAAAAAVEPAAGGTMKSRASYND